MTGADNTPRTKVQPRVWIGVVSFLVSVALVFTVQKLIGVPYTQWGDSGRNLFLGAGVSLIVTAVFLIVVTSFLGWWRPAVFDSPRAARRWPGFVGWIMALAIVLNLLGIDASSYDLAFFGASLVLLLVGFTEEMASRGLLIVGLRSKLPEGWVWFISTALFACTHFINIGLGQSVSSTGYQVFSAFLAGTMLYIVRRTTGNLIWAMILHGLWDFSVFAVTKGRHSSVAQLSGVLDFLMGLCAVCVVWATFKSRPVSDAALTRP